MVLSGDGKLLFTGSADGTTRVWNVWGADSGKELCQLISFQDGTWAVIDSEGRYDTTTGADSEHLNWVVGKEAPKKALPVKEFADRYYDPGLLTKHLGLHKERPRELEGTPR
jgi:hypothetical protein